MFESVADAISKLSFHLSRLCLWISSIGIVAITAIIFWQVIARYVFNASPSWSEQLALYLLVWTVLFAAAAGVREQFHIHITVFQNGLNKARLPVIIFTHVVTASAGLTLAVYGTKLVSRLWQYPIPSLGLPRGSAFLPLPLAGALICFFAIEHIIANSRNEKVIPAWR